MNDEAQPLADTYAERRLSRAGARRHTGANAALAALVLGLMAVFAVYDAVFGAGEVEAAVGAGVRDILQHAGKGAGTAASTARPSTWCSAPWRRAAAG